MHVRPALVLSLCLLSAPVTQAQTATPAPVAPTAAAQPVTAQAIFERGAALLKEFYFGFSTVNVAGQIEAYRSQLEVSCAAQPVCTPDTGDRVLADLYRSLGDRHLYALNAQAWQQRIQRYETQPKPIDTFGLTLGPQGARGTLVLDVLTGSPAERAGIVPGDLLRRTDSQNGAGNAGDLSSLHRQDTVTLTVQHGRQEKTLTLHRASILPVALPSLYTPAEAPVGVRVLRIPSFAFTERVGPKVHELVKQAQQEGVTALIVDLRRGPGGSNYECEMAAAAFTGPFEYRVLSGRGSFPGGWLGTRSDDQAERAFFDVSAPITQQHLAYELPGPARWTGKTVVLVDSRSASCHEYMAYFMQQKGIPVIGEPTLGLMNTATLLMPLPGGGAVGITAIRSAHPDGTVFPERLTPNEPLAPDWQGMADGQSDPMLKKAFEIVQRP